MTTGYGVSAEDKAQRAAEVAAYATHLAGVFAEAGLEDFAAAALRRKTILDRLSGRPE